jgi:L-seryl-tRNA(Ser) seleniumtransferase
MRALRPDKLTLAGLAATLSLYRDGHMADVPAVRMIARTHDQLHEVAQQLRQLAGAVGGLTLDVEACTSTVGGGAMPTAELRSWAVTLGGRNPETLDKSLRAMEMPVIGTIRDGKLWLDVRTIGDEELATVAGAVRTLASPRA